MPYVNNNNFRRYLLTVEKRINGVVDGAATVTLSLLDAIPNTIYGQITPETFSRLSDADFTARLNAFYTYVENTYTYFDQSLVPTSGNGAPSGTDAVACPIPAPVAKQITFRSQLYTGGAPTGMMGGRSELAYGTEKVYVDTAGQAPSQVVFDNTGQTATITTLYIEYNNNVTGRLQIEKDGITIYDEFQGSGTTYTLTFDVNSDYRITSHIYNNF